MYMHRNQIHCEDMTQSLLIYTERQQRLCAHAATNIRHSHSHCEGTTQLLRTYTSVRRSKSIDFSLYQIDNDSNVFAHALQLIYDIHTVIAKTRFSFCAHTHLCDAENQSISIFWSTYMRRKTSIACLTRSARWSNSKFKSSRWSDQLSFT